MADEPVSATSQLRMRRPDLAGLPDIILPVDLTLRAAREDEMTPLAALLQRAFRVEWTVERARREFHEASNVLQTFVIARGETLLATASVQVPDDADSPSGIVHWVGVEPEARGAGLGAVAVLAVLHEFARLGRPDAYLTTDDFRLPAIKTYLRLGFVPEFGDASHPDRWKIIAEQIAYTLPPAHGATDA